MSNQTILIVLLILCIIVALIYKLEPLHIMQETFEPDPAMDTVKPTRAYLTYNKPFALVPPVQMVMPQTAKDCCQ